MKNIDQLGLERIHSAMGIDVLFAEPVVDAKLLDGISHYEGQKAYNHFHSRAEMFEQVAEGLEDLVEDLKEREISAYAWLRYAESAKALRAVAKTMNESYDAGGSLKRY